MIYNILRTLVLPRFIEKLEVAGQHHIPKTGGFVLAPNHVDWLDGFYLSAAVVNCGRSPVKFLTASNNYWWSGAAIQIPAFRGSVVDRAVRDLRRGAVIANFPEGQRNHSATLLLGKTGTVRMAVTAEVPIIPVGIRCGYYETFRESWRAVGRPDNIVAITFGPAYTPRPPESGLTNAWLTSETAALMSKIAPLAGKGVQDV